MKISIIIAGYGHPELWKSSLMSVQSLPENDAEIICVDDASGDLQVKSLLEESAKKDPRVKNIIRETNGGVCEARNSGLAIANGEYVGFMDFDDAISSDVLMDAVKFLDENPNCDICTFGVRTVWKDIKLTKIHSFDRSFVINEVGEKLYVEVCDKIYKKRLLNFIWNKVYRKSLIDRAKLRFQPHAVCYEDIVFNLDCLLAGARIGGIPQIGYCWFRFSAGTTLARYRPWIEEGIAIDSERKRMWAEFTGSQKDPLGLEYEPAALTRTEQIEKNLYRLQTPYSYRDRIAKLRSLYKCSNAYAVMRDVRGFLYHTIRRYCYFRWLERLHIRKIMPGIMKWHGELFR